MIETWRWFGPDDPVSLQHARQAGARGIVHALHEIATGDAWSRADIDQRKRMIEGTGLEWSVVESIPVHTDIKTRSGRYREYIDNYKESLRNVGSAGIGTVCYNFMAVIDWTRTSLDLELPDAARALSFDMAEMAAYDIHILRRGGAIDDYTGDVVQRAADLFRSMSNADCQRLETNILAGLPGGDGSYSRAEFAEALAAFNDIDDDTLRANYLSFLAEVLPVAEASGVRLCVHPDDPPFRLFGLPRVMSTADDARRVLDAEPSESNGLTLCAGSFGARSDNDLVGMVREFGPRIFFVHLRNVQRSGDGSFFESSHLDGDNDMLGLVNELLAEEERRAKQGAGSSQIPMRPDHGHLMGDELDRQDTRPGYSFAGRMKGLAELRGVIYAIENMRAGRLENLPVDNAGDRAGDA